MCPSSSTSRAISPRRRCDGLVRVVLKLGRGRCDILLWGECLFLGGSTPKFSSNELHAASCDSIFSLMAIAWSAIRRAWLSSDCFSSSKMRPRSSRFSDMAQASSLSSSRILRALTLLHLARSLFCRSILRRSAISEMLADGPTDDHHDRRVSTEEMRTRLEAVLGHRRFV